MVLDSGNNFCPQLTLLKCCIFTSNGATLIVGVRDDCNLHFINVHTLQAQKVNMNAMGDAHVSFTSMDLALSNDEQVNVLCVRVRARF